MEEVFKSCLFVVLQSFYSTFDCRKTNIQGKFWKLEDITIYISETASNIIIQFSESKK